MSDGGARSTLRLTDPKVLVGLAISAVAIGITLRGVDYSELGKAIAAANLWILVLPSVAAHVFSFWIRALRWRHLVAPVQEIERGPLFRAVSVGFMANNVFPLRLGELVRAWYLARETGASSAALLGTVIAERVIDVAFVLSLAALVFTLGGASAMGLEGGNLIPALIAGAVVPIGGVVALRVAPERTIRLGTRITGWVLPAEWNERLEGLLIRVTEGLGALRGGRHLWWLAAHSLTLWLVAAAIPFLAAILALDIELDSAGRTALAVYTILVFIGFAVAVPSAPGFFGPYHFACWLALRPFGVGKEQAIALGTLAHGIFWLTATGLGLLVLRFGGTDLEEAREALSSPE